MAQDTIPSIVPQVESQINVTIEQSQTKLADQGYTYNQAGFSYNQAGVQYAGAYNLGAEVIPAISLAAQIVLSAIIEKTQALLADQGYTYNQAGFTYNQAGVMYGGLYNINQDVAPAFFNDLASFVKPSISGIIDIQGGRAGGGNSGMLMGILGLTYP